MDEKNFVILANKFRMGKIADIVSDILWLKRILEN